MPDRRSRRPQWLPARPDLAGLALAVTVGVVSQLLALALPRSPFVSDVLVALVLGALILNTPLRRVVRLALPGDDREPDRYAPGLRFVGKWVLRLGIIAMGLKVQTAFFGAAELATIAGVGLFALPSAFFVAHALGARLGLRRPLTDLLAGGTMICGASAVNAIAPIARAHREEQGIAIAVMFLFSVVALVVFQPVAAVVGLDPSFAGIWSGLAVNDLSSAVAVGAQMGGAGGVMATAAKSARVLMLAPALVVFSLLRREPGLKGEKQNLSQYLPRFVLGYVALAALRAMGDRVFAGAPAWGTFLDIDKVLVDLCMSTVSASIGLHLALRTLFRSGARAALVGGGASLTIAAVTLTMVTLASRGAYAAAGLVGVGVLLAAGLAYRLATSGAKADRALRVRFEQGSPLALSETRRVLDLLEADGPLEETSLRRVIHQLHPAIGELIPVRESPLPHGAGCRWVTYWEGRTGWALVALAREPGATTPIHAHSHRLLGKAIEGMLEELRFDELDGGRFALASRKVLGHNELVETSGLSVLHVVRAVGDRAAIDLQLRGPELGSPGRRVRTTVDPLALAVGDTFAGAVEVDDRPGHGGEGASVGRPRPAAA